MGFECLARDLEPSYCYVRWGVRKEEEGEGMYLELLTVWSDKLLKDSVFISQPISPNR